MLEGFIDFDMSGDVDSKHSTSGYVMTFLGVLVSYQSRLQNVMALSTTDAKYMAVVESGKELIWIRDFLSELGMKTNSYFTAIIKVPSTLLRMLPITLRTNISKGDIGYEREWKKRNFLS